MPIKLSSQRCGSYTLNPSTPKTKRHMSSVHLTRSTDIATSQGLFRYNEAPEGIRKCDITIAVTPSKSVKWARIGGGSSFRRKASSRKRTDFGLKEHESEQLLRAYAHVFKSLYTCVDSPDKKDSFVNSQEWTLSRSVPDLKLGVVGSLCSGKSSLVHRYLTGSYMQEESPEGGRFKKEVVIEGGSHLLLIRDEGGIPESQFTHWVDAVIFVFSLESEQSFQTVYQYYAKMAHYRNTADIPLILVGTQDAINADNPRVIDDSRARKLAHDLKRCTYYETCATYGLNVEKVFVDACQKILHQRVHLGGRVPVPPPAGSCPSTPNPNPNPRLQYADQFGAHSHAHHQRTASWARDKDREEENKIGGRSSASPVFAIPPVPPTDTSPKGYGISPTASTHSVSSQGSYSQQRFSAREQDIRTPSTSASVSRLLPSTIETASEVGQGGGGGPTPTSTPTTQRKNRRISNIFNRPSKDDDKNRLHTAESVGSGRAIPIRQGHLMKRSSKAVTKEWKKKYVCLFSDGRLSYHSSLKDYMENSHGKEIFVGLATVKVPGQQRPTHRAHTQPITCPPQPPPMARESSQPSLQSKMTPGKDSLTGIDANVMLTAFEPLDGRNENGFIDEAATPMQSNKKKPNKHTRKGSGTKHDIDDPDCHCEFVLVSSDQKQWHFEANSAAERDEWVTAIQNQIAKSLQDQLSNKKVGSLGSHGDKAQVDQLRQIAGNSFCVDCSASNPDWASLNLGALMCIECSGIHRNLGSHISKVRSLHLDEWPVECISVMQILGNEFVNSLWECNTSGREKPKADSSRESKEAYIRAKYEFCSFLAPLNDKCKSLRQHLIDSVLTKDIRRLSLVLAWCQKQGCVEEQVCGVISGRDSRTPLLLACAAGAPLITQMLLWYNADATYVDDDNHSALWFSQQSGNAQCVQIIRQSTLNSNNPGPPLDSRPQSYAGPGRRGNGLVNGSDRRESRNGNTQRFNRNTREHLFEQMPASAL